LSILAKILLILNIYKIIYLNYFILFLIFTILIGIFVKDLKLKKNSMRQFTHTMSFTICSKWADERAMSNSLDDTDVG
jgi:hypothetical protein